MNKKIISVPLCLCVVLGLGTVMGMTACSDEGSETSTTTTTSVASDETNAPGNTIGAYIKPISLTADNENYEQLILSSDEISEIYTFTLEGKTYTLPCSAQEFAQAGWAPLEDLTIAAQHYSSENIPGGGFYLNGDDTRHIGIQLVNTSDAEAPWLNCTVVGVTVLGSSFEFETSRGLRVGDPFVDIQEAYGASSYNTDRFATIGYHFTAMADPDMDGSRWYGQSIDTLTFLSTTKSLYISWTNENYIDTIRMEYFGDIAPSD